jgi:putative ABC transport system permease protein
MRLPDLLRHTLHAVESQRLRSLLTGLGIAVGIAAVVLLTAIGEGVHRFVLSEFSQFGTNLLAVTPGKTSTMGMSGAVISTVRPLSLEDAEAMAELGQARAVVPMVQGNAAVEAGERTRRTMVLGVNADVPAVWKMAPALGRFLPADPPRRARPYAVLGSKLRDELFGSRSPLGERVRIGSETYRVIGVMESKGQMLGFDLDDTVFIPVARAMAMFNRDSLMEIDLLYTPGTNAQSIAARVKELLIRRHGREDFTITTQDQMIEALGSVLDVLTLAVGALGAISLLVGGVGILTIMTIAVKERTGEIGLMRAIGAARRQILALFLAEAVVLASLGGLVGLLVGAGGAWLLGAVIPALPTHIAWNYVLAAEAVAAVIGILAGVVPALQAARLDPVQALRDE